MLQIGARKSCPKQGCTQSSASAAWSASSGRRAWRARLLMCQVNTAGHDIAASQTRRQCSSLPEAAALELASMPRSCWSVGGAGRRKFTCTWDSPALPCLTPCLSRRRGTGARSCGTGQRGRHPRAAVHHQLLPALCAAAVPAEQPCQQPGGRPAPSCPPRLA